MKIYTLIFLFSILISNITAAQNQSVPDETKTFEIQSLNEKSLQKGFINYFAALNRDNSGLIESAITNIMIMKLYFPDRNYDKVIEKLTELVTEGSTKLIRYKAFITCNYLKHPERFNWIKKGKLSEIKDFFNKYSIQLAKQLENTKGDMFVVSK